MNRGLFAACCLLAIACSRPAAEDRTVPVPSAPPPAPPAPPPPPIALRLQARAQGKGAEAWLVAPELGLEERVGELAEPYMCSLTPTSDGGQVSCTPDAARPVLTIKRSSEQLVLERSGVAPRSLPAKSWTVSATAISAREAPGLACPEPKRPPRDAPVRFLAYDDMIDRIEWTAIIIGPHVIKLWPKVGGRGCSSRGTESERTLTCKGIDDVCTFRLASDVVTYECKGPPPYVGRLILPC
ncbi:MAG TPA: hypothetical protein VM686_30490, partial [Polyangiaceae bacterium]|nr:hypothetical protein [Polyangiaceae bacterium]